MYSTKKANDNIFNTKDHNKTPLPQLPPLDTRNSFLEKSTNDSNNINENGISRSRTGSPPKHFEPISSVISPGSTYSISPKRAYQLSNNQSPTVLSPTVIEGRKIIQTKNKRPPPPSIQPYTSLEYQDNKIHVEEYNPVTKKEESSVNADIQNFQDVTSFTEIFSKPPPVPSTLRNISGISKVSDSIESYYSHASYSLNNSSARHSSYNSLLGGMPLDIAPSVIIPTQPFSISLLDEKKLYQCYSVYRLSDIYEWILKVYFEWFTEYLFGHLEFHKMIQRLLEFQIPNTFDQDVIDSNVDKIINSLLIQNAIKFEPNTTLHEHLDAIDINEITIVTAGLDVQGVFTELLPCYSFDDSIQNEVNVKCYSRHCQNRSKTISRGEQVALPNIIQTSVGVWADFWHLTQSDLDNINAKEVQKQSFIFDLIMLEERSLNMANAAVEIYGKQFDPNLLPDDLEFSKIAFDVFKPLIELHTEFLLNPIMWKIKTVGKFITGIGKLYLKWCHEVHDSYIIYARSMATVHEIIKYEKKRQSKFSEWLKKIDNTPEVTRSKMYHDVIFFGGFFKSLQNLPITLKSIFKNTVESDEDYEYLKLAIEEVENLNTDVDKAHGEAIDHRNLIRFSKQLIFDSRKQESTTGYSNLSIQYLNDNHILNDNNNLIEDKLDLGLINTERRLIFSGMLLKKRETWFDPTSVYIALLDNYLLITEPILKGSKKWYKLTERPIPIDYLSVERKKPLEQRSNRDRSILHSENSKQTPLNTALPISLNSAVPRNLHGAESAPNADNTFYATEAKFRGEMSFKIRNIATNESFRFITSSVTDKETWINAILNTVERAKQRVETIIDCEILTSRFAYSDKDAPVNLPVAIKGSELDIALKKYDNLEKDEIHFPLVCNIFASTMLHYEGKTFLLVANNYGVWVRIEEGVDGDFRKIIECCSVTMMEVSYKLGLLFLLDNGNLVCFSLASILGAYYDSKKYLFDSSVIGIVIKDKVDCFKFAENFGNSKHLLFERKGKIHVLTPEFDQITKRTKYFKEYKQYKLPTLLISLEGPSVSRIIPLKKSFFLCTSKGLILFFDEFGDEGTNLPILIETDTSITPGKLVADVDNGEVTRNEILKSILKEIMNHGTKPLSCFQLTNYTDFIVVYDKVIVKLNSSGSISDSRKDILTLDFYCTNATMLEKYLILISDNLLQVYDTNKAINTPLNELIPDQTIKAKKIRLLSRDSEKSHVLLSVSHPNIPNRQLVLKCNIRHP